MLQFAHQKDSNYYQCSHRVISRIKFKGKINEKALGTVPCTNEHSIYVKNNFQEKKVHRIYILKAMILEIISLYNYF